MEPIKKMLRPDYTTDSTFQAIAAKITVAWAALFAGFSLGDMATAAALVWTSLNIIFLLYDRLIKPRKKKFKDTGDDPQFKE